MKDAKGHGSDPRGKAIASAQAEANRTGKPMSVLNLNTVGRAMHIVRDYDPGHEQGMYAHQFVAKVDPQVSGGQPVASNAHAAATLASGPKSAPVETHPAFESGRADRAARAAAAGSPNYRGSGTGPGGIGERQLIPRNNFKRHGF